MVTRNGFDMAKSQAFYSHRSAHRKYRRCFTSRGVITFTLSRLGIGMIVALLVAEQAMPDLALALLLLFAGADLLDGELARKMMVESPLRKAIDATVDRLIVLACFASAWRAGELPLTPVILQFIAAGFLGSSSLLLLIKERRIVHGPQWHRVWSLSSLLTGILVLLGLRGSGVVAFLSAIAAAVTMLDLLRRQHLVQPSFAAEAVSQGSYQGETWFLDSPEGV
jgi:phosphatidylglycerophosphate synthase